MISMSNDLNELIMYNKKLKDRIKLIILNKMDLCSFRNDIKKFVGAKGIPIITISCMKDTGIDKLKKAIETI